MKGFSLINRSKYKIVDDKGKTIAKGFRSKTCAAQMLSSYKLNRYDQLEIVEE